MKQGAKRRKWCLILLLAALVAALMYLWIAFWWPPLWYYQNVVAAPRELPTRLARPAFRMITGRDLPGKTEGLRAVFSGGRDPSVFVRFRTDSSGIAYIQEQLPPTNAKFEPFFGTPRFHIVSSWEQFQGIRIIDRRAIKSGLMLDYVVISGVSMRIIIDTQHNNVQIRATRK
jgi:hypothetical protein